ncbi:MAG: GTPase HflX, partial [Deltaproteobacteria bacterium]|nr:GTPase HflX [Deltaproteobacteria bacterium]
MKHLCGHTGGLKANQLRRLENLSRRRIPIQFLLTSELTRDISLLSRDIRRQIGLLINRKGRIEHVVVGDAHGIIIPDLSSYRLAPGRLRGLRCVHTHLNQEALSRDDLTDLALLRLDLMASVTVDDRGKPGQVYIGHILPKSEDERPYRVLEALLPHQLDIDCLELIQALESELAASRILHAAESGKERAILVSVTTGLRREAQDRIRELDELARSCDISVVSREIQRRRKIDPKYLMGVGKLKDLAIMAMQNDVTLLVFDQELNPSQIRAITNQIEIKVIDRTQLILDIFAQRAQTREGKFQVELAQLKYLLPRLVSKNTAMSRLTGGIGGRGPGETKLEINRRRARDRIGRLEKDLIGVRHHRKQQRAKRDKRDLPVISI